jgi:uncharacterized protein YjlB
LPKWNSAAQLTFERKPQINRPRIAAMSLLEDVKRITEKATGRKRPDNPQDLLRERKPQTCRFKDDGLIPNHPKWPLVIYKNAVRLPEELDPAAVFEHLFESNGWRDSWRDGIYDYVHYHSRIHEVLGIARGSGRVQFGGPKGRTLVLEAGDAAILPAGTGHQCLEASADFLVVGAYPPTGTFDICTTSEDRKKALVTIPKVARPRKDPVYGTKGPLMRTWRKPIQRTQRQNKKRRAPADARTR